MDLKVVWTNGAISQLESIFDFYKTTANITVARKITKWLVRKTNLLSKQSNQGQREVLLNARQKEYRYLVEGHYKIIYWVEAQAIFIAAVFDSRQNPDKLKKLNI